MAVRLMAGIAVMVGVAWAVGDAHAERQGDRSLQRAIDARLRAAPGARKVARNEILFEDGVRVTFVRSGRRGSFCGPRRFCVWANANYRGIQASFPRCTRNRPRSYRLRKYGLPPKSTGFLTGVSSWRNNMGRGYSAQFLDTFTKPLIRVNRPGGGNMPRSKNDKAAWVDLLCLR